MYITWLCCAHVKTACWVHYISYMLATFYMASSTVKYRHTEIANFVTAKDSFHKIKRKSKRSFHKSYNYDAFNLLILLHAYYYIHYDICIYKVTHV